MNDKTQHPYTSKKKRKKKYRSSKCNQKYHKKRNLSYGQQILLFLRKNAPSEYNVKTISKTLNISYNATKVALSRLRKAGKVKRPHRGFYRVAIDEELVYSLGNPPIELHGIKIEGKLQKAIDGISSDTKRKIEALGFVETTNNRSCHSLYFKGRKITITIHEKGLVEVWVKSSNNPMNYEEFRDLLTYLNGFTEPIMPIVEQRVRQIGLNRDYRELRLDGVNCITLRNFMNAMGRIYYREKDNVRVEQHITTEISLEEALIILSMLSRKPEEGFVPKPDEKRDVI